MNVKIVLAATAFAGTLALAAPSFAQDNAPAGQSAVVQQHHQTFREARGKPRNHMVRGHRMGHRRGGHDVDAREREETARLNQEQLHSPGAPPSAPGTRGM